MNIWKRAMGTALLATAAVFTVHVQADGSHSAYAVTITNITKGEIFTPIMVASHKPGIKLFELGSVASTELEMLAEGGDTAPLSKKLLGRGALDIVTTEDVLPPGQSVTVRVRTNHRNNHVSVAAMLVPSNDAFFAVNGIRGPRTRYPVSALSPAYDAGTESNDELCVSIPGPPFICAGEGFNDAGGEGYVYIHQGIQGIANLNSADHDWHNPVAKISIKKIRIKD
jgi:hypothetical protein